MSPVANEVEHGETIAVGDDASPSIKNGRAGRAVTAATIIGKRSVKSLPLRVISRDTGAIAPGHDAEAVMLNFMQPAASSMSVLSDKRSGMCDESVVRGLLLFSTLNAKIVFRPSGPLNGV